MRRHRSFFAVVGTAAVALALAGAGCNSATGPTGSRISMTSKYTPGSQSLKPAAGVTIQTALGVDSIVVTRARIVISHIEFERESGECAEFKTAPLILEPNLAGTVQEVAVVGVPLGTYEEVQFKIHHIDSSEIRGLPAAEIAQFAEFLAGERHSIIIDGTVYRTGMAPQSFRFTSQVDAEQEYELTPPLVLTEADPVANVTLEVNASGWFRTSGGELLDPTDPANESQIDESLKASIKVFCDDDRDGEEDHDD